MLFILLFPFSIPYKQIIGIISGLLAFSLFEYLTLQETKTTRINLQRKINFSNLFIFLFVIIYAITIVLALFSTYNMDIYTSWADLSLFDYLRLLASILLTSFLPGYVIVNLIFKAAKKSVSKIGVLVLSILTSLGFSSGIAFIVMNLTGEFALLQYALLFANLGILLALLASYRLQKKNTVIYDHLDFDLATFYKILIFVSIISFVAYAVVATHSLPQTFDISGDEYDHVGLTVQLLNGWQSWQSAQTQSGIYPYFLHLVFLCGFSLSGVAMINTFLSFSFLFLLPTISFYFMATMLFENKPKYPVVATTIFSTFAGFGWLYASYLQKVSAASDALIIAQAGQRTYDVFRSSWLPIYLAPYIVDLAIFFVLIGLICSKDMDKKIVITFTIFLVSFCALVHIEKILIFSFLVSFISLLYVFNLKFLNNIKAVIASVIGGLLLALAVDSIALYNMTQEGSSVIEYAIIVCFGGLLLVFLRDFGLNRLSFKWLKFNKINTSSAKELLAYLALGLYILFSIALFYSNSSYSFNETSVPLWFLPLKLGVAGLLVLFALFSNIRNKSAISFPIALSIGVLLLEIILYHSPFTLFTLSFSEFRIIRDVLWAFLSLIAGFGLIKLFEKVHLSFSTKLLTKYLIASLLIFIIIVVSVPSHLLKVEYFSTQEPISNDELVSLKHLSTIGIPSGSYVLTGFSKSLVYAATGVPPIGFTDSVFSKLILNSKSSDTVLWTLNYLNVSYIYFTENDFKHLNSTYSGSYFNWFLQQLPLEFSNNYAKIYAVPSLTSPGNSDTAVLTTADFDKNYLWVDDSFATNWTAESGKNVEFSNFTLNEQGASLTAGTVLGQQAAIFYTKELDDYVYTTNGTSAFIVFKSDSAQSFAILDIIYSNGETQRLTLNGNSYMNSLNWITASGDLQPEKLVKAVRIGLTDSFKGNGAEIGISLDYLGLEQAVTPEIFNKMLLLASLMKINYTSVITSDPTLFTYKTLIVTDQNLNANQMNDYLNWVSNGGTLVLVAADKTSEFSRYLGITNETEIVTCNSITAENSQPITLPELNITKINFNGTTATTTLASFASGHETLSPYAFMATIGQGRLVYLDIISIIDGLKGTQNLLVAAEWTGNLLKGAGILSGNSSDTPRGFYVKNNGDITMQGVTTITASSIVSDVSRINGLSLYSADNAVLNNNLATSFSNGTTVVMLVLGNVTISPVDSDNYYKIIITGNATFKFILNNSTSLSLLATTYNTTTNQPLILQGTNLGTVEFIVRNPAVQTTGNTFFQSLYVSFPYDIQSNGDKATFNGNLTFSVLISEKKVILLDNFQLIGTLTTKSPNQSVLNTDFLFFLEYPGEVLIAVAIIILLLVLIKAKSDSTHGK